MSENSDKVLELSPLAKTWILDVDGTLVKHNGYKIDGFDTLLPGVKDFFEKLSPDDKIILLTAREEKYLPSLKDFLIQNNIRFDHIITNLPHGERILVNDDKESGLKCAYALRKKRDGKFSINYNIIQK